MEEPLCGDFYEKETMQTNNHVKKNMRGSPISGAEGLALLFVHIFLILALLWLLTVGPSDNIFSL